MLSLLSTQTAFGCAKEGLVVFHIISTCPSLEIFNALLSRSTAMISPGCQSDVKDDTPTLIHHSGGVAGRRVDP